MFADLWQVDVGLRMVFSDKWPVDVRVKNGVCRLMAGGCEG